MESFFSGSQTKRKVLNEICPKMHTHEIHAPYVRHLKVSPSPNHLVNTSHAYIYENDKKLCVI